MIDKDLLKKMRQIQFLTRKKVTAVFAGEYVSAFKGQGMEFEEVRAYQPGDEVRWIDWNVTARTGEPHIKRFREERELTVFLLVDLSASGSFGAGQKTRNELAAEVAAVMAFTAIQNNDRVGLLAFTDTVEKCIHPGKGQRHVMRIIREILSYKPVGNGTSLKAALDYLGQIQSKKAIVFLISDFIDHGYEKKLAALSRFHDVVAVSLQDEGEMNLPKGGLLMLRDLENGQMRLVDSSSVRVREAWAHQYMKFRTETEMKMRRRGIDMITLTNKSDWVHDLSMFFLRRQNTARRTHG